MAISPEIAIGTSAIYFPVLKPPCIGHRFAKYAERPTRCDALAVEFSFVETNIFLIDNVVRWTFYSLFCVHSPGRDNTFHITSVLSHPNGRDTNHFKA